MMESLLAFILAFLVIVAVAVWMRRSVTTIYPPNSGLLYRNGKFVRQLEPGR